MVLGLGSWEIVLVGLALLIFFGPEHAPKAVRTLGRWQARVRSTLQQIEQTIEEETDQFDDEVGSPFRPSQPPPEAETWTITEPQPPVEPDESEAGGDDDDVGSERDRPGGG